MAKIKNILKQIKPTTLKNIKSSYALEMDYYKKLKDLSIKINKSVLWWAMARYNKTFNKNISKQLSFEFNELLNEWEKKTDFIADALAKKISKNTEKYVNLKFTAQNKDFNINSRTQAIKNQLQAIYEKNYELIKTIPSEIIERYRSAFLNNIGSFDREAIYKQAKTFQGISNRRAKTIARDQTQKAVSGYTQARAQQLGFEYYQWVTAGDERVSTGKGGHRTLNGRIYKYSEPSAIVDSYGNKGHPSTRVNCRCTQVSIIQQPNQEFKLIKDSVAGDYYILVEKK
ncbi:TPA: phage minor head protein [Campylobacter jejuni]